MTHETGHLTIKGDIYYQCWLPEKTPRALLLVVHGLAEHCGRYMNLVHRFVPEGYAIYGFDLPGHGKSYGKRVFVDRFEDYIETLKAFLEKAKTLHPNLPVFLVGHSMGSLVSTIFLMDHSKGITGAILSGCGSVKVPDNISKSTILAGKIFSRLIPKMGLIGLDVSAVSRDPKVVKAYVDDPLVYNGKTTARLAAEILRSMQRVPEEASGITLPILLIQGGADRLVDPSGARMLFDRVGSKDKTLKIYDGLYHEIFNEPERERVLDDMARWLESHLQQGD